MTVPTPFSEVTQENEINKRGLNAPRLTPEHINFVIVNATYVTLPDTLHTFCVLKLKNGFTVSGENACVSKENWREDMAQQMAYEKARDKVWELEGYLLKQRLYEDQNVAAATGAVASC